MFSKSDAAKWVISELSKEPKLTGDNVNFELCIAGKHNYYVTLTSMHDANQDCCLWLVTTSNGFLFSSDATNGTPAHASIEKAALIQWVLNDLDEYFNDLDKHVLKQGLEVFKANAIEEKIFLENLKNEVN